MFCANCGNKLDDNAKFCPLCGQTVEAKSQSTQTTQAAPEQTVYTASAYTAAPNNQAAQEPAFVKPLDEAREAEKSELAKSILVKGILSLVFAEIITILGIIFGSQGKRRAEKFEADFGSLTPKARVGKYLSIAGFIVGWVCTGIYIFSFFLGILIGLMGL